MVAKVALQNWQGKEGESPEVLVLLLEFIIRFEMVYIRTGKSVLYLNRR